MDNKIILTIGRQFGSGGREIGKKLAQALGIGYYDKELMAVAAKESGLSEEFFEKADERASSGLAYAFTMGYSYMGMFTPYNDIPPNDGLFNSRVTQSASWHRSSRACWWAVVPIISCAMIRIVLVFLSIIIWKTVSSASSKARISLSNKQRN